ncbi:MAG: carboxylating nicotinate-nucleotide diphosphorylase [Armatimonadetes bacterium]|nr:carboxylating nicotinate-nucleotide diphosphorylase [Armatimonadota bacterium]
MSRGWKSPAPFDWQAHVHRALAEDIVTGDLSAAVLEGKTFHWYIEAEAEGVACGLGIAYELLISSIPGANGELASEDGDAVSPGKTVISGSGPAEHLLSRERVALNYIIHLSGIATVTSRYAEAIADLPCEVVDTRKTLPGLRALQKYAVRCGGGRNHRMGLYDGIMLKDNHIQAYGSITKAVEKARSLATHMMMIEVECTNESMVDEAVEAGADIVMLDNMSPDRMSEIVAKHQGRTKFEASGGITLDTIRAAAESGVDAVSVGALTHSAPGLSFHMEMK